VARRVRNLVHHILETGRLAVRPEKAGNAARNKRRSCDPHYLEKVPIKANLALPILHGKAIGRLEKQGEVEQEGYI
jgi:hypothetical protein